MNTRGNKSSSEIPLSPRPVLVTGTEFKELVHGNNNIPVFTCPGSFNPLRPGPAFCPGSLATGGKHIPRVGDTSQRSHYKLLLGVETDTQLDEANSGLVVELS